MTTHKERMLAGELFLPADPELAAEILRAEQLSERFNASSAAESSERRTLLVELLGEVGEDVEVRPPFRVDYGYLKWSTKTGQLYKIRFEVKTQ